MPRKSRQLNFSDARAMFDIVQECLALWADPDAWQTHLLRRTAKLADCRVGLCYEVADTPEEPAAQLLSATDIGWLDAGERRALVEGISLQKLSYSPLWVKMTQAMSREHPLTRRQNRLIGDRQWFASEIFDRFVRPSHIGPGIMSAIWMPNRKNWSIWCLTNDRSDGPLSERQEQLVAELHQAIAPLIGTRLCASHQRSNRGLSARRREVLSLLLAGRTEKEIASRLFRSRGTIHEHVTYLYDHFNVTSRTELAAYFINRQPADDGGRSPRFNPADWLDESPQ